MMEVMLLYWCFQNILEIVYDFVMVQLMYLLLFKYVVFLEFVLIDGSFEM